jgi:hypothetical protein
MKGAIIGFLLMGLMSVQVFAQHFDLPEPVYYEEKEFTSVAVFAAAASSDAAIPSKIRNNEYFMESVRFKNLADASYESGDYDASAYYASESLRYAQLSDEYVAVQIKATEADALIARVEEGMDWASDEGLDDDYPAEWAQGQLLYTDALEAREAENYDESIAASRKILTLLEGGELASESADQLKKNEADAMIAAAKQGMDWAESQGLDEVYADEWAEGQSLYKEATDARAAQDYDTAIDRARSVLTLLDGAQDNLFLPAQYTVRTWQSVRDCLWNIAGYSWVYGDSRKWKILYDANKSKMPESDNPDLIEPGMIIDIPSINGERRFGSWQQGLSYPALSR